MRALHYSVVMKRELSKKAELSIFKVVFVPILTYGHESWEMTERVRSQRQASEMRFLRKSKELHCSTKCVALRFENLFKAAFTRATFLQRDSKIFNARKSLSQSGYLHEARLAYRDRVWEQSPPCK